MRKLSIICVLVLVTGLMPGAALAVQYRSDVLEDGNPGGWTESLKTFDEESTVIADQLFTVDIWINDVPDTAYAGGFWIDFTESTDKIVYVSAGRYNDEELPGPWLPGGVIVNEPQGLGTLLIQVLNLAGAQPDEDGDIIIARVTFQGTATSFGDAHITVSTHPDIHFWALSPPWDDASINPDTLTVHHICECIDDADCKDRLWCTGAETCMNCECIAGTSSPCDDDNVCSLDTCREADPHCGSDMNCEEVEGVCSHYCWTTGVDPCMMDPICSSYFCEWYSGDPPVWHMDYDCDLIEADGDGSGVSGDNLCMSGQTESCDDNCWMDNNPTQVDEGDGDGVGDVCDNCPDIPNGPYGGTCTRGTLGASCMSDSACGIGGICSMDQEDNDQDSWGDVCDPDDDNDVIPDSEDNCPFLANPDQADLGDEDGVGDVCDNCFSVPNQSQGNSDSDEFGDACDNCPNTSNPDQEDTYPPNGNGIGDACDCEADFNCDGNVDAADVTNFLTDFGRSSFFNPCTNGSPCNGDFNCDVNVDATDVTIFLEDFGRSEFFNPCPACEVGNWCSY